MPTLKLRFPGGRYHATPWGHHVNEGLIEWPPSPWRLLRALIACGFSSQGWTEIPLHAQQLISKLAAVLPSYRLPEASTAHSRHFMPTGVLAKGREQTTLVFDTWANVADGDLLVDWPCELGDEETALLDQLVGSLGYLGRSESWVEGRLIAKDQLCPSEADAFPFLEGTHPGREYEQVSLMAAIPPDEYQSWQRQEAEAALAGLPLPAGNKKPTAKLLKEREKATVPYPADLLACLTKDTVWWKQHGWSQPPGSQRVLYWRRCDSLQVGVPQRARRHQRTPVTTMLLSLTTPSGNRSALPSCTRTLPQAELFHRTIVGRLGHGRAVYCPELTGKDEHGRPLQNGHSHAHTLPLDLDGDERIDHILVHAPMMFGDDAQRAIRESRETWRKKGPDLQVAVVAHGDLQMLRQLPERLGKAIDRLLGPPLGARVWESATPFVPPRFIKRTDRSTLLGQVNAELTSRGLPIVERVDLLPEITLSMRHYIRRRHHGGVQPFCDIGYGLRLTFAEPIHGPLTLGYASHYGLGMFVASPVDDARDGKE